MELEPDNESWLQFNNGLSFALASFNLMNILPGCGWTPAGLDVEIIIKNVLPFEHESHIVY